LLTGKAPVKLKRYQSRIGGSQEKRPNRRVN
jgi:hypothetical protein